MRIEIPAGAPMINRYEREHGNHKRQGEAERYDLSRPKNHSERQDDPRAPLHVAQLSTRESNRAPRRRRSNLRGRHGPGYGLARPRLSLGRQNPPPDGTISNKTFAADAKNTGPEIVSRLRLAPR